MSSVEQYSALLLNADGRPLSMHPLSIVPWYEAVTKLMSGKAERISSYEKVVRSPSVSIILPSVIALKNYQASARVGNASFTRYNIFLRDNFSCQYCKARPKTSLLTIDHVLPRRLGGKTSWTNVVTSCSSCNSKKGGRTPVQAKMNLLTKPIVPSKMLLNKVKSKYPDGYLHESWIDYIYWDSPLEN